MKIGLFDSGIGGLSVLYELVRRIPSARYVYVADTFRAPYGTKTMEDILRISLEILSFLKFKGVDCIVSGCNTSDASLQRVKWVKSDLGIPYYSIVRSIASKKLQGKVAVIGTEATVKSGIYKSQLENIGVTNVFQRSCQFFVTVVEEGITKGKMVDAIAKFYLTPVRRYNPSSVVLGCTHFPHLRRVIQSQLPGAFLCDPATFVAETVSREWYGKTRAGGNFAEFFVTGDTRVFLRKLKRFRNFLKIPYSISKLDVRYLENLKVSDYEKDFRDNRHVWSG